MMIRIGILMVLVIRQGLQSPTPTKEKWGYVDIRQGAHMFWWLYYSDSPSANHKDLPLVMWLQGGPGGSSSGFGNFEEIGPLDRDLKPRKNSWVQVSNILFVDNPVGTGYSYTDKPEAYATDVATVASDMIVLLKSFFFENKEFQSVPFYIFSESYGGKMAAAISMELTKAIGTRTLECNFAGVALGDSWISPLAYSLLQDPEVNNPIQNLAEELDPFTPAAFNIFISVQSTLSVLFVKWMDNSMLKLYKSFSGQTVLEHEDSVMTWGPYLYSTSLLDDYGLAEVSSAAEAVRKAVEQGQFQKATELWSVTEGVVEQNTNGVNFYNILTQSLDEKHSIVATDQSLSLLMRHHINPLYRQSLSQLMNGAIRKKLGIIPQNVTWGGQAEEVFSSMAGDFMRPVVDIVDQLLTAGVNVTVYNGQLDLIVDTIGQELWVKRLKWAGLSSYNKLRWTPLDDPANPGATGAFYKTYKNFAFYWILKAGHMIPSDQGPMALQMLKMVTQQN